MCHIAGKKNKRGKRVSHWPSDSSGSESRFAQIEDLIGHKIIIFNSLRKIVKDHRQFLISRSLSFLFVLKKVKSLSPKIIYLWCFWTVNVFIFIFIFYRSYKRFNPMNLVNATTYLIKKR